MIENEMNAVLKRIANPAWADDLWFWHKPLGPEMDWLADNIPPAAREKMLAALRQIKPRQNLAVLCTVRNEAPFLPEFIAHYLATGANHIFAYTNDNTDGTEAVLNWFAGCAPVTVIASSVAPGVNAQHKHYEHALLLLPELRLYDWVLVVDADEFLVPGAQYEHHLLNLLNVAPKQTDTILFPWRWRHWDRGFERTPGLLAERFPHARAHPRFKPMTRLTRVTTLKHVHLPEYAGGAVIRDSAFEVIPVARRWEAKTDAGGWIEHFWGRSYEEFEVKKRRGAKGELGADGRRPSEPFFTWTEPLTEANRIPVPATVLARQKARLARFAERPGFAALMGKVERDWSEYAARLRQDATLRVEYEEMLKLPPLRF